jgi:arylsulfatase A-like enzyme
MLLHETEMAKSIVLITVDCLRADHVGFLGYPRNTTPVLDSLASDSVVFSNAIVAGSPTYYSLPAIMTSRNPLALGRDVIGIAPGEPTIASMLRQSGYATAAFLAGNPYLSARFGYDIGFETFRDFLDVKNAVVQKAGDPSRINRYLSKASHSLGPVGAVYDELYFRYCQNKVKSPTESFESLRRFPSADAIIDDATSFLESVSFGPFFLWLHLMDAHSPYYPKDEALRLLGIETSASHARYLNSYWNRNDIGPKRLQRHHDEIVALYDAGIRWVDSQIGRFAEELRRRKIWDDCIVVVSADHGEEFVEQGGRYHSPAKLTEELIHVPLLIHGSGCKSQVRKEPFSLVDLGPTILDAAGIMPPTSFRGKSVWQPAIGPAPPVVVESVSTCSNPMQLQGRSGPRMIVVRDSVYKLVIDFGGSRCDLFNLESDPQEVSPIPSPAENLTRRRLLECARSHISRSILHQNAVQRMDACLRDLQLECGDMVGSISA